MVHLLAGSRWIQGVLLVALANVFIIMQLPRVADFGRQFRDDSREQAKQWLIATLPRGATVYADDYAGLGSPSRQFGPLERHRGDVQLRSSFMASDYGSLQSLSSRGECFVVITSMLYDRFLEPRNRPMGYFQDDFANAVQFYRELLEQRRPVWKSVEKYPQDAFTSPDIYIYRLPQGR